jgi:hypothetical protein
MFLVFRRKKARFQLADLARMNVRGRNACRIIQPGKKDRKPFIQHVSWVVLKLS